MSFRIGDLGVTREEVEAATASAEKRDRDDEVAIVKARAKRATRRALLDKRARAITRATDKYAQLDGGEHPTIHIRRRFMRLAAARADQGSDHWPTTVKAALAADVGTRPPLTQMIHRRNHGLQVYLSLLYIANLEFEPGARWTNERDNNGPHGWGELCGLRAPETSNKKLNLRLTRALGNLSDLDRVQVGGWKSRNRFDRFTLHREDQRQAYFVPSASESRSLPAGFFRAGWHLVLTGEEMATLLALVEQTGQKRAKKDADQAGEALPMKVRWGFYGLSPEAFAARHELEEFGLIDMFDPMDRNNGKLSTAQRQEELRAPRMTLKLDGVDFAQPAIEVVKAKLDNPVAPRSVDRASVLGLLDDARRWRGPTTTP